jgi:CheY-like chemotaxis protein
MTMTTNFVSEKRHLLNVDAGPIAIANTDGQLRAMRTEKVDRGSLFLISHTLVWPRSMFEIYICLSPEEPPLHALCTASYVERTWGGFGIGADISSMSRRDELRWHHYVREIAAEVETSYASSLAALTTALSTDVIVVSMAVSERITAAVQGRGLHVQHVHNTAEALELVETPGMHTVLADQDGAQYDGLELCRRLGSASFPTQVVLFTQQSRAKNLELSLYSGAAMAIAKPCAQDLLLLRLVDLVHNRNAMFTTDDAADQIERGHSQSLRHNLSGWAARWLGSARQWLRSGSSAGRERERSAA